MVKTQLNFFKLVIFVLFIHDINADVYWTFVKEACDDRGSFNSFLLYPLIQTRNGV